MKKLIMVIFITIICGFTNLSNADVLDFEDIVRDSTNHLTGEYKGFEWNGTMLNEPANVWALIDQSSPYYWTDCVLGEQALGGGGSSSGKTFVMSYDNNFTWEGAYFGSP